MLDQEALQQLAYQTLRTHVFDNRGSLPLSALKAVGDQLCSLLLNPAPCMDEAATTFAERGVAVSSMVAVGLAVQRALGNEPERAREVAQRLARLSIAVHQAEMTQFVAAQQRLARLRQQIGDPSHARSSLI